MNRFHTQREAKEFLVGEIAREATQRGAPLSDIERKMLYFSETDWTLPDMADVAEAFDQKYDQGKYERKISELARAARRDTGEDGAAAWSEAVKRLAEGDHYLLVMIDQPGGRGSGAATWRAAVLMFGLLGVVYAVAFVLRKYVPHTPRHDDRLFFGWVVAIGLGVAYTVTRLAVGSRRVEEWTDRAIEWAFRARR